MSAGIWRRASRLASEATPFAMATVSRQRGSLPMSSDAKLLITPTGERAGTVGGGCVEADVMAQALATLETGRPEIVSHTLNADVAGDIGLSCGGTVDLFVEPVFPGDRIRDLCARVAAGIESREQVAVCTSLNGSSQRVQKAVFWGDEIVAASAEMAWPSAASLWEAVQANTFVDEGHGVFVERIPRSPRVLIFGAGHVGVEIARLAAASGFYVFVADDREDFANPERVPDADQVVAGELTSVIEGLTLSPDDFVLATTRGHSFDATIVQMTAASPAGYVGMLGSGRKRAVIFKALAQAGVPGSALERVHCPIGLEIGADNPAEIAVSVIAELIRVRRLNQAAQIIP